MPSLSKLQTIKEVEEKVVIPHTVSPDESVVLAKNVNQLAGVQNKNVNVLAGMGIQQMKQEVVNAKVDAKQSETLAAKMAQPAPKMNLLQQKILGSGLLGNNLRDLISQLL